MLLFSLYNLFLFLVLLEYGRNFHSEKNFCELHTGSLLSFFFFPNEKRRKQRYGKLS